MALGRIADINLAKVATLSGGTWSAGLPLTNIQDESRYVGAPARQLTPTVLAASNFDVVLPTSKAVDLVAVLFHTLSLNAKYRLTMAGPDGNLATPVYATGWAAVYPPIFDAEDLEFEDDNWFTGQLATEDLDLYPRHLWISLDTALITGAIRLEFDDATNAAGYFDLGGLWLARTWSPDFNFERGRELALDARDQKDEAPSGREFSEERIPRRRLTVSWSRLQDDEARRFFDAAARARSTRTIIFAPDISDPKSALREAFPATFGSLPGAAFTYAGLNRSSATFREIIQ